MKFPTLAILLVLAASCAPKPVQKTPARTFHRQVGNPAPRIAAFCGSKSGQQVGNGECWTLADEAFRSAGARRPGIDPRVWGRTVNAAKEGLKPGDVIEFQSARFPDGTVTGAAHTAVVVKGGSWEKFTIAEQNWGRKTVRVREMNLKARLSGKVTVYRPQ